MYFKFQYLIQSCYTWDTSSKQPFFYYFCQSDIPYLSRYIILKVKVKVLPAQATKALRVDRGVALPNLRPRHWKWGGWSAPRPGRFTPGKTRYPLYRRLGGPQGRSGRVRKISPSPGFDHLIVQPVASRYTDWAIPASFITEVESVYCAVRTESLYKEVRFRL